MTDELIIGLMSGTSIDGIDAVIVNCESKSKLTVVDTLFTPFPEQLRRDINHTAQNNIELTRNEDSPLHYKLAEYYSKSCSSIIKKAGLEHDQITAIANHGQTVKHEPNNNPPYSLQLGCGQRIADQTGITTITQFRQADLANGGQGAPLMPAFHSALFNNQSGQQKNNYILNLGGIANITQLGSNVIGFDTGPSNTLLDQWIEQHKGLHYDDNGDWANSGKVNSTILATLMADRYLHLPHPKSTGTDYFNLDWLSSVVNDLESYAAVDIQATLLAFTIESIVLALAQLKAQGGDIFVCGGGAHNGALMSLLQKNLKQFNVKITDDIGIPSDWVEAIGFAWLGYCYLHNINSNLPSVTGAKKHVVLGQKYSPQK